MTEENEETPAKAKKVKKVVKKTTVDYAAATAASNPDEAVPNENKITKVISGDVMVQKRGVGRKLKDIFIAADLRTVMSYVTYDILIPGAKNMIFDGLYRGAERAMFGENRLRRPSPGPQGISGGIMSRITYQTPPDRDGYRDGRTAPPGPSAGMPRSDRPEFYFASKSDADAVLDHMFDILGVYEYVSVAQMNDLMGQQSTHTDEKWGWTDLRGVEVKQNRHAFIIDLPRPVELRY